MDANWLGIAGGIIGLVSFFMTLISHGKRDGEQLARIESNGLNVKSKIDDLRLELDKMKQDASVSKTFRDKYEEPIKEVLAFQKAQEKINTARDHDISDIKEEVKSLNNKFDRMMDLFNKLIEEKK